MGLEYDSWGTEHSGGIMIWGNAGTEEKSRGANAKGDRKRKGCLSKTKEGCARQHRSPVSSLRRFPKIIVHIEVQVCFSLGCQKISEESEPGSVFDMGSRLRIPLERPDERPTVFKPFSQSCSSKIPQSGPRSVEP